MSPSKEDIERLKDLASAKTREFKNAEVQKFLEIAGPTLRCGELHADEWLRSIERVVTKGIFEYSLHLELVDKMFGSSKFRWAEVSRPYAPNVDLNEIPYVHGLPKGIREHFAQETDPMYWYVSAVTQALQGAAIVMWRASPNHRMFEIVVCRT